MTDMMHMQTNYDSIELNSYVCLGIRAEAQVYIPFNPY